MRQPSETRAASAKELGHLNALVESFYGTAKANRTEAAVQVAALAELVAGHIVAYAGGTDDGMEKFCELVRSGVADFNDQHLAEARAAGRVS